MSDRLSLIEVPSKRAALDFASAVEKGLRSKPRSLPSRFFYDRRGSELFERITQLPEYYLTRCESSIFSNAASEIVEAAGNSLSLVEFGSGSSTKTKQLIWAVLARQDSLNYAPIDISREFLIESSNALLDEFEGLQVTALTGEYFDAIAQMPTFDKPRLILFLGSNIGNFEEAEGIEFLSKVRRQMMSEDRLLVGIDLVKDPEIIQAAYNDTAGVTAEFNRNLLVRINSELGGEFDKNKFEHQAIFVRDKARIEAFLVSSESQQICIRNLNLSLAFAESERIHTEISQKYTIESFAALCAESGLERVRRWTDDKGWFSVELLRAT